MIRINPPITTYSEALSRARHVTDALLPLHECGMMAELRRLIAKLDLDAADQLAKHFLLDAPPHRRLARCKMLLELSRKI